MTTATERALLIITLVAFGALTLAGFAINGAPGAIIDAITFNWHSVQIFVDLVLAVAVICVWIYRDATRAGRNPWPWIIASAIVGMFSPLVYLLTRPRTAEAA
ncbi:MAG: DUF2834 domain-containing protein [Actinomycetota bacterium]